MKSFQSVAHQKPLRSQKSFFKVCGNNQLVDKVAAEEAEAMLALNMRVSLNRSSHLEIVFRCRCVFSSSLFGAAAKFFPLKCGQRQTKS
jgi:hypothetical protein